MDMTVCRSIKHHSYFLFVFYFLTIYFPKSSIAQNRNIKVSIKGHGRKSAILYRYEGYKKIPIDSIVLNKKGTGNFKGTLLPEGMYAIGENKDCFFDILLTENQFFEAKNKSLCHTNEIKFKRSNQNTEFHNYLNFLFETNEKADKIIRELNTTANNKKKLQKSLDSIALTVNNFIDTFCIDQAGTLSGKIAKMNREITIPDSVEKKLTELDLTQKYNLLKSHFFDRIDLNDKRLLNTPMFYDKLMEYCNNWVIQIPDSIINDLSALIEKTGQDKHIVQFLTEYYFNSQVMGFDEIFLELADKFVLKQTDQHFDPSYIKSIETRTNLIRPNIIGAFAPVLEVTGVHGNTESLHNINALLTILVFWEPNCGLCKEDIPMLQDFYKKNKDKGLEVFAFYTQADTQVWKKFINEYDLDWINIYDPYGFSNFRNRYNIFETPTFYLLDKDKRILTKKLGRKKTIKTTIEILNRLQVK